MAGAGLAGALVLAVIFLLIGESSAPRMDGTILSVRTLGMEEKASVAVVDFTATNNSDVLVQVGDRKLFAVDSGGVRHEGVLVSAPDLKTLFDYFPVLGDMRREPLIDGVKIKPGETIEGMVAFRVEIPKYKLDAREEIILEIHDTDGSITEIRQESELPPLEEEQGEG